MSEGLNDGYLSNMKEFRYVDKVNNVAFRGIVPNNIMSERGLGNKDSFIVIHL